jgi:hypothetical protein
LSAYRIIYSKRKTSRSKGATKSGNIFPSSFLPRV